MAWVGKGSGLVVLVGVSPVSRCGSATTNLWSRLPVLVAQEVELYELFGKDSRCSTGLVRIVSESCQSSSYVALSDDAHLVFGHRYFEGTMVRSLTGFVLISTEQTQQMRSKSEKKGGIFKTETYFDGLLCLLILPVTET